MATPLQGGQQFQLATKHGAIAIGHYMSGELSSAAIEARIAVDALGSGTTWAHIIIGFPLVRALSELGRGEEASEQLAPLMAFARATENKLILHHCLLCSAEIALSRADHATAIADMRMAMASARDLDIHYAFVWRPAALARLCVLALEHGIETETVQHIVRARRLRPAAPPRHLDSWPWRLKIRTLGEFAVEKDGERLALADKAYRKPLELLQASIALGGPGGVGIARLQDLLWPDAEGDAAKHSFEVTLSRLRKAVGAKDAIELRDGKLLLSPHLCWVDAWALKELIAEIASAVKCAQPGQPGEIEALQAKLHSLYRGRFLDDLADEIWAENARVELAAAMARVLLDLGGYWERCGRREQARTCYEQGLRLEGLAASLRVRLSTALDRLP